MPEPPRVRHPHPAEHRALRELYLAGRQLLVRWRRLAAAMDDTPLADPLVIGAGEVRDMLTELEPLTAARGVHRGPAAEGAGARFGELRTAIVDRGVDSGLAARLAVLDAEHLATLLLQVAELARARGDGELESFARDWAKRVRVVVRQVRAAAVALGSDPDRTAAPLDESTLTRVLHGAGWALGSVGEWIDGQAAAEKTSGAD